MQMAKVTPTKTNDQTKEDRDNEHLPLTRIVQSFALK